VDFLIVGLAAAALQGAPAMTQDIDLWFHNLGDPRLHRALRVRLGRIEVPVLPLDRIIVGKRARNRPKDRAILPALEGALSILESRRGTRRARGRRKAR
jgi:hypothetical protein